MGAETLMTIQFILIGQAACMHAYDGPDMAMSWQSGGLKGLDR